MRLRLTEVFIAALLLGCSALSGAPPSTQVAPTSQAASVAWGERVAFARGVTITRLRVFDTAGNVTDRTFNPARAFVDLPAAPSFPDLKLANDPIAEETFFTSLTAGERALYENRGRVVLSLKENTNTTNLTLTPYGAVLSGRVHALASVQGTCASFFAFVAPSVTPAFEILVNFGVPLTSSSSLCHITLDIGSQDTTEALATLGGVLDGPDLPYTYTDFVDETGFVLDKDNLSSLDPPGSGTKATDPSCEQIQKWLDPIGDNNYDLVDMTKLRADIGAEQVTETGSGVQVVIIGGGVDQDDKFRCLDNGVEFFQDHDSHILEIIREIAPGVSFRAFKVCNDEGTCASAEIVRALMQTLDLARNDPKTLVNMSLGGPLPGKPDYAMLKLLGQLYGVPAIVSAGNAPFAPAHYPASYSSGIPNAPSFALPNVIPVAAAGFRLNANGSGNAGYVITGFNTRANAILFAPGVNLCPQTARFRCDLAQPLPDNLGLTGTSFAAPVVTGLAALYTEAKGSLPTRLGRCLANNRQSDPVTNLQTVAFGTEPCP